MTLHRFKIKDLDDRFIKKLKEAHADKKAEITFWLNSDVSDALSEENFWLLIDKLNWEKGKDNQEIIAPVIEELSSLSVEKIRAFSDILSEKLYRLDGKTYAEYIGEDAYREDKYFSVDSFLYARCCVVANGKEFYETVLHNPEQMPKDLTFGALLRIPAEAYELKNGKKLMYQPAFIYETYANAEGWKTTASNDKS